MADMGMLCSVVGERWLCMREVGGSIPAHVKQKTLKSEVLLVCLALITLGIETDCLAQSQENGLRWDNTAKPPVV